MTQQEQIPHEAMRLRHASFAAETGHCFAFLLSSVGAVVGDAIPLTYALWKLRAIVSQPPIPPGQAACGMAGLAAMFALIVGTPFGA